MYDTTTRRKASNGDAVWIFAIFLLTFVPITIFHGWMLSVMWNWFVPNIFDTIPRLSTGEAIGLSLVISACLDIPSKVDKDIDPSVRLVAEMVILILRSLTLLAVGAIVHSIVF